MVYAAEGMTASEKHLLGAYCNHTDAHGYCWPSVERLADETGMSARTVQRTNALLRAKGLIKAVHRTNPKTGLQITNLTRVNLARLAQMRRPDRDYGDNMVEAITFDDAPGDNSFPQVRPGRQSVTPRGDRLTGPGRHCVTPRGDTVTPKPSVEPSVELSSSYPTPIPTRPDAREGEQEMEDQSKDDGQATESALKVVDKATALWGGHRLPTPSERLRLAERAAQALAEGARPADLVYMLSRDLADARSAVAVVMARTAYDGWWHTEVAPPVSAPTQPPRPEWCGRCDERTRQLDTEAGGRRRCPDCHPLKVGAPQHEHAATDPTMTVLDVIEPGQAEAAEVVDLHAYQRR